MNSMSKDDFRERMISIITHEQNIYEQIQGLVFLTKFAHEQDWDEEKNFVFKNLIQVFFSYLIQTANQFYRFDPLIDKSKQRILWYVDINPKLPENLIAVIGLFWELIIKYDTNRGVYFTHYLQKRIEWYYKNLSRTRIRKKKYREHPEDDYTLVSYEEVMGEKLDDRGQHAYATAKIGEMVYDDNFDIVTFEWSLKDPKEFVDNHDLFEATSSFTPKQVEVFALELEGYKQEQIADEIKKTGLQITQQGVNERLTGVRKKIEKIKIKRGASYEPEKTSNHPA
ncbi:hypothetical protein [Paenibacillus xylanexedens]|uniref:hypothetical protein n=1 Tax=Paenibacillus xylanexedens TaxID=528191 RepID=UPI0011A15364|nr:hypothetical protein [Paenibacillus xylanexedens]